MSNSQSEDSHFVPSGKVFFSGTEYAKEYLRISSDEDVEEDYELDPETEIEILKWLNDRQREEIQYLQDQINTLKTQLEIKDEKIQQLSHLD